MKSTLIIMLVLGTLLFSSCENPMIFETDVHADGTLDKTIMFEKGDSVLINKNIFGIDSTQHPGSQFSNLRLLMTQCRNHVF